MQKILWLLVVLALVTAEAHSQTSNPENSFVQGGNWYCNNGYKKAGNECQKVINPENSFVQGDNWYCNNGYKKAGN